MNEELPWLEITAPFLAPVISDEGARTDRSRHVVMETDASVPLHQRTPSPKDQLKLHPNFASAVKGRLAHRPLRDGTNQARAARIIASSAEAAGLSSLRPVEHHYSVNDDRFTGVCRYQPTHRE